MSSTPSPSSPESGSPKERVEMDSTTKLSALIWWLGTFPAFKEKYDLTDVDEEAFEKKLDDNEMAGATLLIAQEILDFREAPKEFSTSDSKTTHSAETKWGLLFRLVASKTRFQKKITGKRLSRTELRVELLSSLLGYAVSDECKERRNYVSKIMWNLERPKQQVLMSIIEQEKELGTSPIGKPTGAQRVFSSPAPTPQKESSSASLADQHTPGRNNTLPTSTPKDSLTTAGQRRSLQTSGNLPPSSASVSTPNRNVHRRNMHSGNLSTPQSISRGMHPTTPHSRASIASSRNSTPAQTPNTESVFEALAQWLQTFSQLSSVQTEVMKDKSALDDDHVSKVILNIAEEICDDKASSQVNSWACIKTLVLNVMPYSLEECPDDTDAAYIEILSTLLCFAVSESCAERRTYIGRIMGLSRDTQLQLMSIIEAGRNRTISAQTPQSVSESPSVPPSSSRSFKIRSRNRDDAFGTTPGSINRTGFTPQRKKQAAKISKLAQEGSITPGTIENVLQNMVEDVHRQNVRLMKELDASNKREAQQNNRVQELENQHRKDLMKAESAASRKEEEIRETMSKEIASLQSQVVELDEVREREKKMKEELVTLKDEVDILAPMKEKMGETEERLRHYKERLELLSDVKEALKREEEAHGASVEECIRLANELNAMQPLKRQLEDYKTRAVEAEVKLAGCQEELEKWEQNNKLLNSVRKDLLRGVKLQKEEAEQLRRQLEESGEDKYEAMAVGEGISELNPEVREEVLRLRNENEQLKAFAAKREDDAVQRLEEQLDDKDRLSMRFKEEFLSTKSTLESTQLALSESEQQEEVLKAEVQQWKENAEKKEILANQYKDQLGSTKSSLEETQKKLENAQKEIQHLTDDVEEWTERYNDAESISSQRMDLLRTTREKLSHTEKELQESQQLCESRLEEINMLTEKEAAAVKLAKEKDAELTDTKTSLGETQEALSQSEKREEKLNNEVSVMTVQEKDLKSQMEEMKRSGEESLKNAENTFEETRKSLLDEAKKEYQELEMNMNLLLEGERKAYKENMEENEKQFNNLNAEFDDLKEKSIAALKASEEKIEKMKQEFSSKLEEAKMRASKEKDSIIKKGQTMIKETKKKAADEIDQMEDEIDQLNEALSTAKTQMSEYETKAKSKISSYKNKLQFATGRIKELTQDNDDMQDNIKNLEREKLQMQEENDRYRRQLGGRYGAGGKVQSQLEMLQKEFNAVVEENRKLKANASSGGTVSAFDHSTASSSYSADGVSRSTLSQLREEYEETIVALNDEKRELIMRNSAAITDVQKAEQKAWASDKEVSKMKEELTSLKLSLQRYERLSEMNSSSPGALNISQNDVSSTQDESIFVDDPSENDSSAGVLSNKLKIKTQTSSAPRGGILSPNRKLSTPSSQFGNKAASHDLSPKGNPDKPSNQTKKVPTLMDYTTANSNMEPEGDQECKQS